MATIPVQHAIRNVPIATQGNAWHMELGFFQSSTGNAADFTTAPLSSLILTTKLASSRGATLATLNNQGTGQGTITGSSNGVISWDLPGSVTATLPITSEYRTAPDPRVKAWRARSLIVMSFTVSDGTNTWSLFDTGTQLTVCPQIGS